MSTCHITHMSRLQVKDNSRRSPRPVGASAVNRRLLQGHGLGIDRFDGALEIPLQFG